MNQRIFLLVLFALAILGFYNFILHPQYTSVPVTAQVPGTQRILLIPLDSRPPCRQFVMDAGSIANTQIITPPNEIMDYYTQAGDISALMHWLENNIAGSDAVILSIDQLLYGGLLAAREADTSAAQIDTLTNFLTDLHTKHPAIPIYAFSILPRLTPPDSIEGYKERKHLMEYSRLLDKRTQEGNIEKDSSLKQLEEQIPPQYLQKYRMLFKQNTQLNEKLSLMAKDGALKRLIIGQDDGEVFGIPNMEKRSIYRFLSAQSIPEEKVYITHGADEIALTLLAEIRLKAQNFRPKIYIDYNDKATPSLVMPYMASSVTVTAAEKIRMLHGEIVSSPNEADFILFISCGTRESLASRYDSVQRLKKYVAEGKNVAVVDLSQHFQAEETLLPLLIQQEVPLNAFIAYAGWNTTSNSIGTVLTQSLLYIYGLQEASTESEVFRLCQSNLTFLNNRYLEDYFYLKDVLDLVDTSLKKAGFRNVNDLDLAHNYRWSNEMLRQAMGQRITTYKNTHAFRAPFTVQSAAGNITLRARDLTADMSYPWPRTFEIYLHSTLYLDTIR